jgi:hypothetical protein
MAFMTRHVTLRQDFGATQHGQRTAMPICDAIASSAMAGSNERC